MADYTSILMQRPNGNPTEFRRQAGWLSLPGFVTVLWLSAGVTASSWGQGDLPMEESLRIYPMASLSLEARAQYAAQVRLMLESGLDQKRDLAEAATCCRRARELCAGDPRLDYACALVYLHRGDRSRAEVWLEAATSKARYPCSRAWRCLVWLRVSESRYEQALEGARGMTRAIAAPPQDRDAASDSEWLGRMMAYLSLLPAKAENFTQQLKGQDTDIRRLLAGRCLEAFEKGRQSSAGLPNQAENAALLPGGLSKTHEAEDMNKDQRELAIERLKMDAAKTSLNEDARHRCAQVQQRLDPVEGELRELEKRYVDQLIMIQELGVLAESASQLEQQLTDNGSVRLYLDWFSTKGISLLTDYGSRSPGDGQVFARQVAEIMRSFTNAWTARNAVPVSFGPSGLERVANAQVDSTTQSARRFVTELKNRQLLHQTEVRHILSRASDRLLVRQGLLVEQRLIEGRAIQGSELLERWEKGINMRVKRVAADLTDGRTEKPLGKSTGLVGALYRDWFPFTFDEEKAWIVEAVRRKPKTVEFQELVP